MERFVRAVVAGGISLVVGLWMTDLFEAGSPAWIGGVGLSLLGLLGLCYGIWLVIEI